MTIFYQTETRFDHFGGKLVKYDNKILAIAGDNSNEAMVEELNRTKLSWAEHSMSPVKFGGFTRNLDGFTALTVEKSLFIFKEIYLSHFYRSVFEWDGTSWEALEEGLCRSRSWHTTFVYAGEIYHMGGMAWNSDNAWTSIER